MISLLLRHRSHSLSWLLRFDALCPTLQPGCHYVHVWISGLYAAYIFVVVHGMCELLWCLQSLCARVCVWHSATACCLWCVSQPDSVCNVICSGLTEKDGWNSFQHNKRAEKVCGCVSVGGEKTQHIGMNLQIWILNPFVLQTLNCLLKVQNPGA